MTALAAYNCDMSTPTPISPEVTATAVIELWERAIRRQARLNHPERSQNHEFNYGTLEGYLQALNLLTGISVGTLRESVKDEAAKVRS